LRRKGGKWWTGVSEAGFGDLKIEALATVDGRPVRGSTLWRVWTMQVFLPGARLEGSGVALTIPVAPGRACTGYSGRC